MNYAIEVTIKNLYRYGTCVLVHHMRIQSVASCISLAIHRKETDY